MSRVDTMNLVLNRDDASNRITALKDKQGWLLEWEQALKAQPKSSASTGRERDTFAPADGRHVASAKIEAAPTLAVRSNNVATEKARSVTTPAYSAVQSVAPGPLPASARDAAILGALGNSPLQESHVVASPTALGSMGRYVALSAYNSERIHLILTSSGVAAYVRTYGLTNESGERLLRRLRRELGTLGMRLAKLVVNGTTTWIQPEPEHAVAADEIIISRDQ